MLFVLPLRGNPAAAHSGNISSGKILLPNKPHPLLPFSGASGPEAGSERFCNGLMAALFAAPYCTVVPPGVLWSGGSNAVHF